MFSLKKWFLALMVVFFSGAVKCGEAELAKPSSQCVEELSTLRPCGTKLEVQLLSLLAAV